MLSRDNCRIVTVKNTTEGPIEMRIFDRFNPQAILVLNIQAKPRPPKKVDPKKVEGTQFYGPNYKDKRLAYCYTKANECGKKAATTWCVSRGYHKATQWEVYDKREDPKLQARHVGNGQICRPGGCDTFRTVSCK